MRTETVRRPRRRLSDRLVFAAMRAPERRPHRRGQADRATRPSLLDVGASTGSTHSNKVELTSADDTILSALRCRQRT